MQKYLISNEILSSKSKWLIKIMKNCIFHKFSPKISNKYPCYVYFCHYRTNFIENNGQHTDKNDKIGTWWVKEKPEKKSNFLLVIPTHNCEISNFFEAIQIKDSPIVYTRTCFTKIILKCAHSVVNEPLYKPGFESKTPVFIHANAMSNVFTRDFLRNRFGFSSIWAGGCCCCCLRLSEPTSSPMSICDTDTW